jgi:MoaA/NifB/PqqE/SkfB family radical SAM enzyme
LRPQSTRIAEVLDLLDRRRRFNYFQIGVSSRCTHACKMCPRTVFPEGWSSSDMTLETYGRVAEHFPTVRNVYLSGWGEPLLNPRFGEMVRMAKDVGCAVGFTTNGALLDDGTMAGLVDDQVDLVSLSLAGAEAATHESVRIGSDFTGITGKLARLNRMKKRSRSEKPGVLLLYMMFKDNLGELSEGVRLAEKLGADGIVATNLDYVWNTVMDELRAFSCGEAPRSPINEINEAESLAERLGVNLVTFSLEMGRAGLCSEDPLNNLYVSEDGEVSPCVYLNLPMGEIPRVFCGERAVTPRLGFGNVNEKGLMEIWNGEDYASFRSQVENIKSGVAASLPEPCWTCYKAYGL